MALQECGECGEKVSDEAEKCPKCGFPDPCGTYAAGRERMARLQAESTTRFWMVFGGILGVLLVACLLLSLVRPPNRTRAPTADEIKAARERMNP